MWHYQQILGRVYSNIYLSKHWMTHQTKICGWFFTYFSGSTFWWTIFSQSNKFTASFGACFFLNKFGIAVYLGTLMFYHYIHGGLSDFWLFSQKNWDVKWNPSSSYLAYRYVHSKATSKTHRHRSHVVMTSSVVKVKIRRWILCPTPETLNRIVSMWSSQRVWTTLDKPPLTLPRRVFSFRF